MSKVIQNINVLDLSSASAEALRDVKTIENVNAMVYAKGTAPLLDGITLRNINILAEIPDDGEVIPVNGQFQLDESFAKGVDGRLFLLVNGRFLIQPDVSVETIDRTVGGLFVNGSIYCPERLHGAILKRIRTHNGTIVTYIDSANVLAMDVRLDNQFLRSLEPSTNLVVMGQVTILDNLDLNLFDERIGQLEFLDNVLIRENYVDPVSAKHRNPHKCHMKIVPTDARFIDDDLSLDSDNMGQFQQANLYVTGHIRFDSDVSSAQLEQCIARLHTDKSIACSKGLKQAVLERCDNPAVTIVDYTGKLVVVDGERRLTRSELQFAEGVLSFINHGMMSIAENVDPKDLFEKIGVIHNYGVIEGNEEQCGAIQAKIRTNKGHVGAPDEDEASGDRDDGEHGNDNAEVSYMGNINYLKL